jgi:hypothetical protein
MILCLHLFLQNGPSGKEIISFPEGQSQALVEQVKNYK